MKYAYLVFSDPISNHNKFYEMVGNGNVFTVRYGRVGANPATFAYPMSQWDKKYEEKIQKGYSDVTEYHRLDSPIDSESPYAEIPDAAVSKMVQWLMECANAQIQKHYIIGKSQLSPASVTQVQAIIDTMVTEYQQHEDSAVEDDAQMVSAANAHLMDVFQIIPRRMENVSDYLVSSKDEIPGTIAREQDYLDLVRTKIQPAPKHAETVTGTGAAKSTILEANGLKMWLCDPKETAAVAAHCGEMAANVDKVFHIRNEESRRRFEKYCDEIGASSRDIKYLYHGTRNCCGWGVFRESLRLHPAQHVTRAGAMFGHGIYFADKARKSCGYTDLKGSCWAHGNGDTGILFVFKVAMKNIKHLDAWDSEVSNWDLKKAQRAGYDSVFAHASDHPSRAGGRLYNNEMIVYSEDAYTPCYLILLKQH